MHLKSVLSVFVSVLLSMVLSSCVVGLLELHVAYASSYTNIGVDVAYNMITGDSYPNLTILDVRTQSEHDDGHIYGALWIPYTELQARIGELTGHENHEIIVYCKSGGRSAIASETLDSNNFTKVYNMLGGISAWQYSGYPVWIATVHNVNTTFNYDTIQAAIKAPQTLDGHTILVDEGTYYENVIVNKTISLIGENRNTTVIDGNGTASVVYIVSDNVTVDGFTIQNGGTYWPGSSIWLTNSDNSIIRNNVIRNNHWYGIGLNYSCYVTVDRNIVKNNDRGIRLVYSDNCTVRENNVYENLRGVWLQYCRHCIVIGNIANNNTYDGIALYKSDVNAVYDNRVVRNNIGILVQEEGNGEHIIENTVVGNVIHNNTKGIWLGWAEHNCIYHNNFLNNSQQVYHYGYNDNTWDNGCEGNYWSNYDGSDLDGDGVGDTYLPWEGVDYYPLMNPYWLPGDVNHDLKIDIYDVVRITGIYNSQQGDTNWNCHSDIAEPYGIINIYDVVTCTKDYRKEYTP